MPSKKNLKNQKSKPASPMPPKQVGTNVNVAPNQTIDATNATTVPKQQPRDTNDDATMLLHATVEKQNITPGVLEKVIVAKDEIIKMSNTINRSQKTIMQKNNEIMETDAMYIKKNENLLNSNDEILKD